MKTKTKIKDTHFSMNYICVIDRVGYRDSSHPSWIFVDLSEYSKRKQKPRYIPPFVVDSKYLDRALDDVWDICLACGLDPNEFDELGDDPVLGALQKCVGRCLMVSVMPTSIPLFRYDLVVKKKEEEEEEEEEE